jgi:dTMP kinase
MAVGFEGPDGSGKGTAIGNVERAIRGWNKYQDIVLTREPTYKARELIGLLQKQSDPMENARRMTQLFVDDDRRAHYQDEIKPDVERRRVVLCDRFSMSTLAYQSAQGQSMDELLEAHFKARIGTPDITFYLALSAEEAIRRVSLRGEAKEVFEQPEFVKRVVTQHELIYANSLELGSPTQRLLGRVVKIDASPSPDEVARQMLAELEPVYRVKNGK